MGKHKVNYMCPSCGYDTIYKSNMRHHLYDKQKQCPQILTNIVLTDEIKRHILANRVYIPNVVEMSSTNNKCIFCSNGVTCQSVKSRQENSQRNTCGTQYDTETIEKTKTSKKERQSTYNRGESLHASIAPKDADSSLKSQLVVSIPVIRKEIFYQKIFERHLGGGHKKLISGETDITTDMFHAEIKIGKDWKAGIGQLSCYMNEDPRKEARLYLFGLGRRRNIVVESAKSHNIMVYAIDDIANGIVIENLQTNEREVVNISLQLS